MRIAVLGGPGAGRETQAQQLAERARVPCICIADLVRAAAEAPAARTKSGRKSRAKPKPPPPPPAPGAPDARAMQLLEDRLRARDAKRGFVIHDFPHTIPEAQALDALLGMLDRPLQIALRLEAADSALIKRITSQANCPACGARFERGPRRRMPVEARNRCDACGAPLATTISKVAAEQLAAYHADAEPLANYYKAQHKLRTIDADATADEVHQRIVDLVDLEIHPLDVKNLEAAADELEEHDASFIAGGQINRIDPTEDILASRTPGEEVVASTAVSTTSATKKPARKTPAKKPAVKKTAKRPLARPSTRSVKKASAKKSAAKSAAKKPSAKKPAAKRVAKKAAKTAAKKVAKKRAKRPPTRAAKKAGHG